MNERNELVETEWAVDTSIVADAKLPVKDEAALLNELERRLAYIWHMRKQIEIQRQAMENQVLFVKAHYEGKIAAIESNIAYLSGAPIAALKEIQAENPRRKSLAVPHGRVQARTPADKIVWGDEGKLLATLKEHGMAWAVRVQEEVNKRELKAKGTVIDGKLFVPLVPDAKEESLIELEGVTVEAQPTKYTVETIK